ncbi:RHS domain-containing protein [Burkholderia plantarii]
MGGCRDRTEVGHATALSLAHYHCDQIDTPQELTDEAGEVAWSA